MMLDVIHHYNANKTGVLRSAQCSVLSATASYVACILNHVHAVSILVFHLDMHKPEVGGH